MSFRAGDHVRHGPTGEDWILACDQEREEVMWCGWPEGWAKAKDCTLVQAATDEERLKMLRDVCASMNDDGQPTMRALLAQHQLTASQPRGEKDGNG